MIKLRRLVSRDTEDTSGEKKYIVVFAPTVPLVQQVEKGNVVAPLVRRTPDQALDNLLRALQVFRASQLLVQLRLHLQAIQLLPAGETEVHKRRGTKHTAGSS